MDKPNITSNAKHHAPEGGTFELTCEVKTAHDVKFKIEWIVPEGLNKNEVNSILIKKRNLTLNLKSFRVVTLRLPTAMYE